MSVRPQLTPRQWIEQWAEETDIEVLLADGFDDAILGVVQRFNDYFVLYDRERCLEILQRRDGMEPLDAEEYFDFNVTGAWVGDATPAFSVWLAPKRRRVRRGGIREPL